MAHGHGLVYSQYCLLHIVLGGAEKRNGHSFVLCIPEPSVQLDGPSFPETDKLFHLTYIWLTEGYRLPESLEDKFSILEPTQGVLIPWWLSSGWGQHIKQQEQREEQNGKRGGPADVRVSPLWKGWSRAYYTKNLSKYQASLGPHWSRPQ